MLIEMLPSGDAAFAGDLKAAARKLLRRLETYSARSANFWLSWQVCHGTNMLSAALTSPDQGRWRMLELYQCLVCCLAHLSACTGGDIANQIKCMLMCMSMHVHAHLRTFMRLCACTCTSVFAWTCAYQHAHFLHLQARMLTCACSYVCGRHHTSMMHQARVHMYRQRQAKCRAMEAIRQVRGMHHQAEFRRGMQHAL